MASASSPVLLDTGVLVAILDEADPFHEAATEWMATSRAQMHTVEAVLTECAFFLPSHRRDIVADFAAIAKLHVHCPDSEGYSRIGAVLRKYVNLRPDWADATLVWLAEKSGVHRIATLDVRDFSTYRIHGRSKFLIEPIR